MSEKDRPRMMMDIPRAVQLAIRLRAIKAGTKTGAVVSEAIRIAFPEEMEEAIRCMASQTKGKK